MKYFILSILAVLSFSSCEKDDVPTPEPTTKIPFNMVSECNEWHHSGGYSWYENKGEDVVKDDVVISGTDLMYTWSARKYYFSGDTTISSRSYKKMYFDAMDSTSRNGKKESEEIYTSYVAAMRQDGEKVYYLDKNMTEEELYADMGVEEGERLEYAFNYSDAIVKKVTYISLDAYTIRKYKLSNGYYFLEGVGSTSGLFKDWQIAIHGDVYLDKFVRDGHEINIEEYPFGI